MAQSAGEHRGAEHQQNISDNGADDRRFHDIVEAGAQSGDGDDHFGCIAERRIEEASHAFPHTLGEMLRGPSHPSGQWQNGEAGR